MWAFSSSLGMSPPWRDHLFTPAAARCTGATRGCHFLSITAPTIQYLYAASKKANELMARTQPPLWSPATPALLHRQLWVDLIYSYSCSQRLCLEANRFRFSTKARLRDFTYVDDIIESLLRLLTGCSDPLSDKANPDSATSYATSNFHIGHSNPTPLMEYMKLEWPGCSRRESCRRCAR